MPQFSASRRVSVPADVAFAVASDVAKYHEFLPLLEGSTVLEPVIKVDGNSSFKAELAVGYAKLNIREKFISQVTCKPQERTVTAVSQDAPFKNMTTIWRVREVGGVSDISIQIDYSMRSMMMQLVLAGVMELAVNKVVAAFEARALAMARNEASI
jgi:coenzyme Q-binding protein COQ10